MLKKRAKNECSDTGLQNQCTECRREMLSLCYKRLREIIPECNSEVTLIKCIELLEKYDTAESESGEQKALCAIASTLDRLAEIK